MKTNKWIIRKMEAAVITKQALADAVGVSVQTVSSWIDGKKEPSEAHLEDLKTFLGED